MGAAPTPSAEEAMPKPSIEVPNWAMLANMTVRWMRPSATWFSSPSRAGVTKAWAQPITRA